MKNQRLVCGLEFDFEGERFVINSVRPKPFGKVYFAKRGMSGKNTTYIWMFS